MSMMSQLKQAWDEHKFKVQARRFLIQSAIDRGEPWRNRKALAETVRTLCTMDADLRDYVSEYLLGSGETTTDLGCEVASIEALLQIGYDPIQAALYVQWYRREPKAAAAALVQYEAVRNIDIPVEPVPEKSEEE